VAVAATAIIPGVDPAVFLSTLGLYRVYVAALAELDFSILLPMAVGLAVGAVAISFCMSRLFKRFYTATYSVIFGIFLSMIPNMLTEKCVLGFNLISAISIAVMVAGFFVSYCLGKREKKE
jgi:putative membrane protein